MGYDRIVPKKAINVTVNEDLLAAFVARERARHRDEDEQMDRLILHINALHAEHGLLSNEFQDF